MTSDVSAQTDRPLPQGRTREQLRAHFEIEREFASRLMNSTRTERRVLYASLCDELFRRVPDHSQLVNKQSPEDRRKDLDDQIELTQRFLSPEKIEIGSGDCALHMRAP